ncbi:MAG: hypothetical protein K2M57_01255, partial [Paramuribaculum sp.]|nr:hypothetical protein [Paramuribaculum sp.]
MNTRLSLTFRARLYTATLYQLAIAFLLLWLTRIGFIISNPEATAGAVGWRLVRLCLSGIPFDL